MKNLISIIWITGLCCLIQTQMYSQTEVKDEGVNFEELTYAEALKKAAKTGKLVFLDAYTGWCGACREMDRSVFPQAEAGKYFNSRFVCVRYNTEKGEGLQLQKRFHFTAYPTYLILRPDGTVQHRVVGGDPLEKFIAKIDRGLVQSTSSEYLNRRYTAGGMSKNEMLHYVIALEESNEKRLAEKVATGLFHRLSANERLQKRYWPVYEVSLIDSIETEKFHFLLQHKKELAKVIGRKLVDTKLVRLYSNFLYDGLTRFDLHGNRGYDIRKLQIITKQLPLLQLPEEKMLTASCNLVEAKYNRNIDAVITIIKECISILPRYALWGLALSLDGIGKEKNKAYYQKLIAVEPLFLQQVEKEEKGYLEDCFANYHRKASVGVYWENISLQRALERARIYRKNVFVDAYTSWCGPCKMMLETVFPQEEVGDFFMKEFICVKYDMEKGEGVELRKKYGINIFPTFLIIRPDGMIQHCVIGGCQKEDFLKKIRQGLNEKTASGCLERRYKNGERNKEFMLDYMTSLLNIAKNEQAQKVAFELFQSLTESEKTSKVYWELFRNKVLAPYQSGLYTYLLSNRKKFDEQIGHMIVDQRLMAVYEDLLRKVYSGTADSITLEKITCWQKEAVRLELENGKVLIAMFQLAKAKVKGKSSRLISVCGKEFPKFSDRQMYIVMDILNGLRPSLTPEQKKQIAGWENRIIPHLKNEFVKKQITHLLQSLGEG